MRTIAPLFWALALGVIAAYLFFVVMGAFAPGEVAPVTVLVAVLVVLWALHARAEQRAGERDPRLRGARERRGF